MKICFSKKTSKFIAKLIRFFTIQHLLTITKLLKFHQFKNHFITLSFLNSIYLPQNNNTTSLIHNQLFNINDSQHLFSCYSIIIKKFEEKHTRANSPSKWALTSSADKWTGGELWWTRLAAFKGNRDSTNPPGGNEFESRISALITWKLDFLIEFWVDMKDFVR